MTDETFINSFYYFVGKYVVSFLGIAITVWVSMWAKEAYDSLKKIPEQIVLDDRKENDR